MKRFKRIILCLLVLLLSSGISYAIFTDAISVNGTASGVGTFDMNVTNVSVAEEIGNIGSTIEVSSDKKTVTVNVPALQYPGAYTLFSVTIKNEGTVNAKLIDIVENSMGDSNIGVSYTNIAKNSTLAVNESITFNVKVEWISTSTAASKEGASINIDFIYEQNV